MGQVEVFSSPWEVTNHVTDAGQPLVLHEVEADIEGDEVAVLVRLHAGRQLLEELGPQPRAGQVDLLRNTKYFL